jgi:hypothetical protein
MEKSTETVPKDTVTVDAVHPRLLVKSKEPQKARLAPCDEVSFCIQCNEHIGNTVAALRNHFERSLHESQPCVYCGGPVYKYISRSEQYYHECILNTVHEEESNDSDTSSLSKDEDNDNSETQNVTSTKSLETTSLFYEHDTDSHSRSVFEGT